MRTAYISSPEQAMSKGRYYVSKRSKNQSGVLLSSGTNPGDGITVIDTVLLGIITKKGNTAAINRVREMAWQKNC